MVWSFDWRDHYWTVADTDPSTHVFGTKPYYNNTGTPDGMVVLADADYATWVSDGGIKSFVNTYEQLMEYINLQQVQSTGSTAKHTVRAATTANITLSAEQTVDGIALVAGDRCLVKEQSSVPENGIYVVSSGDWYRASDANAIHKLVGAVVYCSSGTTHAGTMWVCQALPSYELDTDNIVWRWFGGNWTSATVTDIGAAAGGTEYLLLGDSAGGALPPSKLTVDDLFTSRTLVTPTLGVATATSINKVAITAPATAATLTLANNKTFTVNNTLTLSGTDSTTMTFPASTTTVAGLGIAQTFTAANVFSNTTANTLGTAASGAVQLTGSGGGLGVNGNITSGAGISAAATSGLYLGTVQFAFLSGNYHQLKDPAGTVGLSLGNASDPTNYYDNTTHIFRTRTAAATSATLNATSIRAAEAVAIPSGGTAGTGYTFSSTSNFGVFFGSGAPTLSAAKGSLYLRSDGSATNNRAYINTDGSTAWTALTTAT